jgi:hypothetical protein
MNTKDIAQWLIENPQEWFRLAEYVAELMPDYARQLSDDFDHYAVYYAPPEAWMERID